MRAAERRARRLLAAYPWRVRAEQGDEIVGTVLDTLPPGAERLPWGTQLDLLRGGWRVRSGRRPPWPTVVAYRMGARIGPRWIRWVYDDLEDPHYRRNARLRVLAMAVPIVVGLALALGDWLVLLYSLGGMPGALAGVERDRQRRRARHGLVAGGSDPSQVWGRDHRRPVVPHLPAVPILLGLGLPLACAGPAGLWAASHQHPRPPSDAFGTSIHPAAPTDLLAAVAPFAVVGGSLATVALVLGLLRARRAAGAPGAVLRAPRATRAVATVLGAGLAGAAAVVVTVLRWRWVQWPYVGLLVGLAPVGVALVLLAVGFAVAGRRRGVGVGVWDVVPRLGPRVVERPLPRWVAEGAADRDPRPAPR